MRRSATCSERARRAGAVLLALTALVAAGTGSAPAGVLVEAEAALKRVFPAPLVVAKKTAFLWSWYSALTAICGIGRYITP